MSDTIPPLRIALIGAGTRGQHLANQLMKADPDAMLHAVADPDENNRNAMLQAYHIDSGNIYGDWSDIFGNSTGCNAAIIATKDHMHTGPVLAALENNWHILLEKPMAHTYEDCASIRKAWRQSQSVVSVCHSLRYRADFSQVKSLVDQGAIGEVTAVEHREGIEPIRFSHNYVRGKWAREKDNTFLLLHKSSHDLDFIAWLIDKPCLRVSSFGGRSFFRPDQAPEQSGTFCLRDCPIEPSCLYSARKIYLAGEVDKWPARDVISETSIKDLQTVLEHRPYGRCVWKSANDVVDHQVVSLEFHDGVYVNFTLVGLSHEDGRHTHIFGTKGNLIFSEAQQKIMLSRFGEPPENLTLQVPEGYHPEDHDMVSGWLKAIYSGDHSGILVDPDEAFKTHILAFAAEQSRKQGRMVDLSDFN